MVNILYGNPFMTLHYLCKIFIFFRCALKAHQDLPFSTLSSPTLWGRGGGYSEPSNRRCPHHLGLLVFPESSEFRKATSQYTWFLLYLEFPLHVPFISPSYFLITSIDNSSFSSSLALWQSLSGCPPSPTSCSLLHSQPCFLGLHTALLAFYR